MLYPDLLQNQKILYLHFQDILNENDTLENRVKIAIVGNILDFGAFTLDDDIDAIINESLKKDLAVKDIEEFEKSLNWRPLTCVGMVPIKPVLLCLSE